MSLDSRLRGNERRMWRAPRETSAPAINLFLHVERMAGVAGDAERAVEPLHIVLVIRAPQLECGRSSGRRPPREIGKLGPDVRRRKGVLHRIEIDVLSPLIRARRKQ